MSENDYHDFAAMLNDIWTLKQQALTPGQKAVYFRALQKYPLDEVRAGFDAHVSDPKRGQFLPMPADVVAQIIGIVADDGRPGPEEAWAMAVKSQDEAVTMVWTAEMAEALAVCRPLLDAGDDVGARMAFKEAYTRMVNDARQARARPVWAVSLGHNAAGRDAVLLPHVEAGRISRDYLDTPAIGFNHLLLAAPVGATASNLAAREAAIAQLSKLRDEFAERKGRPSLSDIDNARTAALKAEAAQRVAEYEATHTPGEKSA